MHFIHNIEGGILKDRVGFLNSVGHKSIRKPIAWLTCFFIMLVIIFYMVMGEDIPDRIANILVWMIGIPVTVVGSSSYEAVRLGDKPEPEKEITMPWDSNTNS